MKALGLRPRAFISFLLFETPMKHSHSFLKYYLKYSQYIVSDKNKHFSFELDGKLNPWLKFEPNLLTWLPNGK